MKLRTTALAAAATLVLGVASACSGDADDGGGGVLTISTWDAGTETAIDAAAADFGEANPDIEVEVERTPWDQHMQGLRRQLNTNDVPDVAATVLGYGEAASSLGLADSGLLAELDDAPWAGQVPEADRFLVGGEHTYALPLDFVAIGAFYDPALFAQENLTPPSTIDDVLALCQQAQRMGKTAFAMAAQEGAGFTHFLGFALAATLVYGEDPQFSERRLAGDVTFAEQPGWEETLARFAEMSDAGCFGEGTTGTSRESAAQAFAAGEALIAVAPTVTLPLFQASNPDASFEMFPFPASDDADQLRVMAAPATGLVVPERSDNQDVAREFVDFYAENRAEYSEIDNSVPGIPTSPDDSRVPEFAESLDPIIKAGRTAPVADATWPSPEVLTTFNTALVNILMGEEPSAELVATLDAAWPSE